MSITSSAKRSLKHPTTKRVGWIVALGVAAAAAVGATIYFTEKNASAASAPWVKVAPQSDGSGNMVATIPVNAVFAISDISSDPSLPTLVNNLNTLANGGNITSAQAYQVGQPAPSGFPSDGLGANAYRATGVVGTGGALTLTVTQTTGVWMRQQASVNYLTVITDAPTVTQYQNVFATALGGGTSQVPGLSAASYSSSDVDGNPSNPKWMSALSIFQKYANTGAPFTSAPPGYPTQLRTDGVLDYATALMVVNA